MKAPIDLRSAQLGRQMLIDAVGPDLKSGRGAGARKMAAAMTRITTLCLQMEVAAGLCARIEPRKGKTPVVPKPVLFSHYNHPEGL